MGPDPTPARGRSLGERVEWWFTRRFTWGPRAKRRRPPGPVPAEPGATLEQPPVVRSALYLFAVALPLAVAVALIPLRGSITASTAALVLVLPVVAVSIAGRAGPGAVSAIAAALAFDVLLTEPHYSVTIDAADDIEAALVLGVIALIVSSLVSREVTARARSAGRHRELAAIDTVTTALSTGDRQQLERAVTDAVRELVGARACDWAPDYHGRVGAVLQRDATVSGAAGPALPELSLEIPVVHREHELGRLIVRTASDAPVSTEERRTLLLISDLFAVGLAQTAGTDG